MLGNAIKSQRQKIGLTQKQLAKSAGIAQTMISKTEANKSTPSIKTLEKIAGALGTTASVLLSDATSMEESGEISEENVGGI